MNKLSSLSDAVASIPSGSHVALSGFSITRCVMAFAREVIRQGIRNLTVSQCVGAMDTDLLVGGGTREQAGLGGGPSGVIPDKAMYGFHPETGSNDAFKHPPGQHARGYRVDAGDPARGPDPDPLYGAPLIRAVPVDPRGDRSRSHVHGAAHGATRSHLKAYRYPPAESPYGAPQGEGLRRRGAEGAP